MNFHFFVALLVLLIVNCVIAQNQWRNDYGMSYESLPNDPRIFVPIFSDKRSIDQKIRSLKDRTANGQFKNILFG